MSQEIKKNAVGKVKTSNIIYPIIIGFGVIGYMVYTEFNPKAFSAINFTTSTVFWLIVAALLMAGRDLGYMIRIRLLADNHLSWRQAFRIIMLWEFTSAVTPSAVGGTSVALLFVHKEGISIGKSSAIVMATSFLDEIYFIVAIPLAFLFFGKANLFNMQGYEHLETGLYTIALVGYLVKLAYTILLSYGLFYNPKGLKWLIVNIFSIRYLRKWRYNMTLIAGEIMMSSKNLRSRPASFWIKTFGATCFSWTSRYLVVNALLLAFFAMHDQLLIFSRQMIMWVMMLISPTPGGSGFAEYLFTVFLGDLIPVASDLQKGLSIAFAFIWRLISYYPYLVIGALILPRWLKHKFHFRKIPHHHSHHI
ncbi:lysylphosphatidylglycerol synthase transmembrane domain-containing protein [uncultured Acetobacteroides sp.]|uniref:lysylphosphatidylglycerol synthase transmembrane domain-containing protein n=1 Tax=uncultured Acetobacteroides sp. TaxID=1760811 RepID=UPI0029F489AA|nr:lysylphosphatidylglycerol synthase transmembrane domain-containing protein [uncultured Acetobacteroides sp.]